MIKVKSYKAKKKSYKTGKITIYKVKSHTKRKGKLGNNQYKKK
jgi:hypothetical protein